MTTPAERDAIRAEAFRDAAEIIEKRRAKSAMTVIRETDFNRGAQAAYYASIVAIEARAKEKQP
jgi:hypothetical protein